MILHKHSVRNPSSNIIITDPDGPGFECDLLQCVHCGRHWKVESGSRKKRGFCYKCMGVHCGPDCVAAKPGECVPQEKYLDNVRRSISI